MINFIKNYSIKNIRNKLVMLYILNVTDIICTLLLLSTGYYMEANVFMTSAVQNPTASIYLKILLPAIIVLYVFLRIQNATEKQLWKTNVVISSITVIYAFINFTHLVWFALLPIIFLDY